MKPGIKLDKACRFDVAVRPPLAKMLFTAATLLVGTAIMLAGRALEEASEATLLGAVNPGIKLDSACRFEVAVRPPPLVKMLLI